jgi:hypothetical protein
MSPDQLRKVLSQLDPEDRIGLLLASFIERDGTAFSPFTGMSSAMMVLAKRLSPQQQQIVAELLYRQADRLAVASLATDFAQEVTVAGVRRAI